MSQIYLEIGSLESLTGFIQDAKGAGLLKDISTQKVADLMSSKEFPVRVPVELDQVLKLMANPMVRKIFGKKIEETTVRTILKAAKEGA